jgi:MFS transporter, SP family, galactose:H+ symporter
MATGLPTTETAKSPLIEVPEEGLRQIRRWAWVIALGSFLFGYDSGVISGALLFLKEDLHLNDFEQGSVVSVLLLGAIAGLLAAYLPLLGAIGTGETFWLFAVVCAFGIWFVRRYVPETKDREFPEVDAELQAHAKGEVRLPAGLPGRAA